MLGMVWVLTFKTMVTGFPRKKRQVQILCTENVLFPESQSSWMSGGWLIGSQDVPGLGMEGLFLWRETAMVQQVQTHLNFMPRKNHIDYS